MPAVCTRVLTWDRVVVLEGLSLAPFGPIEKAPEKFLTLKSIFLLAISSVKGIEDLQALSVAPSFLEFSPGVVNLLPKLGLVMPWISAYTHLG